MSALAISITGHRPADLVRGGEPVDPTPAIAGFLGRAAARARAGGVARVRVITGGALGIDQLVAAAVAAHPEIDGIAFEYAVYLPFPIEVMAARWKPVDRARLEALVAGAVATRVIAPAFDWGAYQRRNQAMVDDSEMLVGFWTGKRRGGTYNCLRYALTKAGKPTYNALDGFRRLTDADIGRPER
jgi:uncharacterized phage-like protein YoqJ